MFTSVGDQTKLKSSRMVTAKQLQRNLYRVKMKILSPRRYPISWSFMELVLENAPQIQKRSLSRMGWVSANEPHQAKLARS